MTEVVNLRRARKARDRATREEEAARNRARFGQAKAARTTARAERDRAGMALDGHRIAPADGTAPQDG